jgi:acyl carrier protein
MEESVKIIILKHLGEFDSSKNHRRDFDEWDSITHLRLIMELGTHVGVKLTPDLVESIKSIEDIKNWINNVAE